MNDFYLDYYELMADRAQENYYEDIQEDIQEEMRRMAWEAREYFQDPPEEKSFNWKTEGF